MGLLLYGALCLLRQPLQPVTGRCLPYKPDPTAADFLGAAVCCPKPPTTHPPRPGTQTQRGRGTQPRPQCPPLWLHKPWHPEDARNSRPTLFLVRQRGYPLPFLHTPAPLPPRKVNQPDGGPPPHVVATTTCLTGPLAQTASHRAPSPQTPSIQHHPYSRKRFSPGGPFSSAASQL